jgi:hypothetical protein
VREFFSGGVFCVWNPSFLGWVVGAARGDNDTGGIGEVWAQEVEEECVADMVYGKGLFDAVGVIGDAVGELEAGIHDESGDLREGLGGVRGCEFTDFGERGEVKREIGDIGLAEDLIDGAGSIVAVGSRGNYDSAVRLLAGEVEGAFIA